MTEREQLVHAYVDGELDAEARQSFEARCATDATLREELARLSRLREELSALPAPETAPHQLADRIMRRVLATPGGKRPWWSIALRPIAVPAWALALMIAVGAGTLWAALDRKAASPPTPSPAEVVAISPEPACPATESVPVRFMLHAPRAAKVNLVGDFNGWHADRHMLTDTNTNGVWIITVQMRPGRYQYKFVVDGQWIADPDANTYTVDGFGGQNAVISL